MPDPVWFWQRIVSPHMAGLAAALAARGRNVTYVAEREMSAVRAAQGWRAPKIGTAHMLLAPTAEAMRKVACTAQPDSVHICQGFRGNGLVAVARSSLAERGLRQWVVMETVDDAGLRGVLKRLEYRRLVRQWRSRIEGVLATGHATPEWLAKRGMPADKVFPFAYFLPDKSDNSPPPFDPKAPFRTSVEKRPILLVGARAALFTNLGEAILFSFGGMGLFIWLMLAFFAASGDSGLRRRVRPPRR